MANKEKDVTEAQPSPVYSEYSTSTSGWITPGDFKLEYGENSRSKDNQHKRYNALYLACFLFSGNRNDSPDGPERITEYAERFLQFMKEDT